MKNILIYNNKILIRNLSTGEKKKKKSFKIEEIEKGIP